MQPHSEHSELSLLNAHELERLKHCERIVERGLNTVATVGVALMEINESRLYRATHSAFQDYVRERFRTSSDYAYKLIRAASTAKAMQSIDHGLESPHNERQCRPLTRLEPEVAAEAWGRAVQAADGQPTASQVEAAVAEVTATKVPATLETTSSSGTVDAVFNSPPQSCEWWTPERYIEPVRELLGWIDLDPASCAAANEIIRAKRFYARADNGIDQPWEGTVWLNPPRSKHDPKGAGNTAWVGKLLAEVEIGRTTAAVTVVNCQTADPWFLPLWRYPLCFANHRISFIDGDSSSRGKDTPRHSSVFVGLGVDENRFAALFEGIGHIVLPIDDKTSEVVK